MNRRTLGKGRILGATPPARPASLPAPAGKYLPPSSDSSASLTSSLSGSTVQDASSSTLHPATASSSQDLESNVSLPLMSSSGSTAASASAGTRLICPICNEQMMTLLQLNRHLDDLHANLEDGEQVQVKNWFQAQVDKARRFTPLAVLNQKFRALDVFESNSPTATPHSASPGASPAPTPAKQTNGVAAEQPVPQVRLRDPEEDVTRSHWQRPGYADVCSDTLCEKRLGSANGSVNCRKCGKLFCDDHTMYQMKLSRSAKHDPVRGVWCRVCETCYKSREGYNDNRGFERNHTEYFMTVRQKSVDKLQLETSRLEKRLSRLTQLLANPPDVVEPEGRGILWTFGGNRNQQRVLEQSIIAWEEDTEVPRCRFCQQEFSNYSLRRHHCRLCGRVVCGDVQTQCSSLVGLNVVNEKARAPVKIDVRMCKDCRHTLFSKADFDREIQLQPPDHRSYENLVQFEWGIRRLLPKFQKLLIALQDPDHPPDHTQVTEAAKVRKRLTDSFIQYESAARRIRDLVTTSPSQAKLQKAVYQQASNFLHLNMLPLKSLPKILKHASPHGAAGGRTTPQPPLAPNGRSGGALASIKLNDTLETGSQHGGGSVSSAAALESLEAEERDLRERLGVLEEQKFLVQEMLANARRLRRFEEMAALSANVDDLSREIDAMQARVLRLEGDFREVYEEIGGAVVA